MATFEATSNNTLDSYGADVFIVVGEFRELAVGGGAVLPPSERGAKTEITRAYNQTLRYMSRTADLSGVQRSANRITAFTDSSGISHPINSLNLSMAVDLRADLTDRGPEAVHPQTTKLWLAAFVTFDALAELEQGDTVANYIKKGSQVE